MGVRGGINEEKESEGKLREREREDDQPAASRRFRTKRKTDQSAGQVDTCRPCVRAVDPLGFWKAEESGTCHGVVLINR